MKSNSAYAPFKRALLALNGQPISKARLKSVLENIDIVIAADGGANWLMDHGTQPDLVIGDLDSIRPEHMDKVETLHVEDQARSDLQKAMTYLIDKGYHDISIAGVNGKRLDHTLCNIHSLIDYAHQAQINLLGQDWQGFYIGQSTTFHTVEGTCVSLVPLKKCQGVTLEGFQYPWEKENIGITDIGLSNIVTLPQVRVGLQSGLMMGLFYDIHAKPDV